MKDSNAVTKSGKLSASTITAYNRKKAELIVKAFQACFSLEPNENSIYDHPLCFIQNGFLIISLEANLDQTGRAFIQDTVMSLLDEGCIALVPVDTDVLFSACSLRASVLITYGS